MIVYILDCLFWVLELLILVRVILSWIRHDPGNPLIRAVYQITEPVMEPFRRLIPPIGDIDISPVVVFVALEVVRQLLENIAARLLY